MTESDLVMKPAGPQFAPESPRAQAEEYLIALEGYLAGSGETSLGRAYEIGRTAFANGEGVLEMALLHHTALEKVLPQIFSAQGNPPKLRAAGELLAEILSPFEMALRGVRETNGALRHYNERLEQETKRIAHVIHDNIGQLLFALHLALAELGLRIDPSLLPQMGAITDLAMQMEQQLRQLSHELRPTMLDDLGLIPALESLADGVTQRSGIHVAVLGSLKDRLPSSLETVLYRAVQEALANVARHSKATWAKVILERKEGMLCCTVRDNGVGCGSAFLTGETNSTGLGLIGIRERLDSVGGTLEIGSHAGRGMQLKMTIHLGG